MRVSLGLFCQPEVYTRAMVYSALLATAGYLWSLHAEVHFYQVLGGAWISFESYPIYKTVSDVPLRAGVRLFFGCACAG